MTDLTKATESLRTLRGETYLAGHHDGLRNVEFPYADGNANVDAAESAVLTAFAEAYAPVALTPELVDLLAKAMEASGDAMRLVSEQDLYSEEGVSVLGSFALKREDGAWCAARDAARAHARQALSAVAQAGQGVGT